MAWAELLLGTEVKVTDNESRPPGHQLFYPPNERHVTPWRTHLWTQSSVSVLIQSDLIEALFFLVLTWVLASDLGLYRVWLQWRELGKWPEGI